MKQQTTLPFHNYIGLALCFVLLYSFPTFAEEVIKPKSHPIDTLTNNPPNTSFLKIKKTLKEALEKDDFLTEGLCYQEIGALFYFQAAYAQAINYYYKADKIFREKNATVQLAGNLNKIGETYYYARQYRVALEKYQEALKLYQQLGIQKGIADSYGLIGQTYEKTQDYLAAMKYQQLALTVYHKEKDQTGIAKIYENIGSIYEDKPHLDSALKYYTLAMAGNAREKNLHGQIEIINNIGDVYRKTGRYPEALNYTKKAESMAKAMNDQYQLSSAYRDLSKTFDLMKRYDSAYHYSELGRDIFLQIFTEDNNKQLALLQTLFEIQQKDDAIAQFEQEKSADRILLIATILIIVLLVCLAASVISRQRLKIKNEQQLNEQNQRLFETQKEAINDALELKSKELTSTTLHTIQSNQFLEELRSTIESLVKDDKRDQKKALQLLIQRINQNINQDQHWKDFSRMFEQIHQTFFDHLKAHCDDLTANDIRLVALIKMNLSSKDMAVLFGISQDSLRVARYRLRKKLNLPQGENLSTFIQTL
ncbi:tetratricopeptide repeat protein [Pedobacter gandavensis]|uniref:tetratricopeptide repeat protein n=1 Tax=Pedobacter gandavensis TaxID=2679963 RepID=UPI00247B0163|nr:tetratricopeptide repeat protein [Pedobacter gandavensis]WGQ08105.1 tetratricopeptide repeat protein [Pedobacter gandavensis]